jgi:hypothetical protein
LEPFLESIKTISNSFEAISIDDQHKSSQGETRAQAQGDEEAYFPKGREKTHLGAQEERRMFSDWSRTLSASEILLSFAFAALPSAQDKGNPNPTVMIVERATCVVISWIAGIEIDSPDRVGHFSC